MSENAFLSSQLNEPNTVGRRPQLSRLKRLVLKELREILRDRRTIITLVVMPILIYPLLAVVFQRFLVTSITVHENVDYVIGVDSGIAERILADQLQMGAAVLAKHDERGKHDSASQNAEHGGRTDARNRERGDERAFGKEPLPEVTLVAYPDETLKRHVADSSLHLAALYRHEPGERADQGLLAPIKWELIYRAGSPTSEAALHFVESRLQAYNEAALNEQLKRLGVVAALPAATTRRPDRFRRCASFFAGRAHPAHSRVDDGDRGRLSGDRPHGRRARTRHAGNAHRRAGAAAGTAACEIYGRAHRGGPHGAREPGRDDDHRTQHRPGRAACSAAA